MVAGVSSVNWGSNVLFVSSEQRTLKELRFCHLMEQIASAEANTCCHLYNLSIVDLPNEAPPIGKIHPITKIALTFEPQMGF